MLRLYAEGLNQRAIAVRLGVTQPTVSYHMRRLGCPPQPQRRHDWAAIGATTTRAIRCVNARRSSASRTRRGTTSERGAVKPRPWDPLEELISGKRSRTHIKRRLVRLGLLEERCRECGIANWRGAPLSLCLHHLNGDSDDNRLENLVLLCPNCHSQTENFAGRNVRRRDVG